MNKLDFLWIIFFLTFFSCAKDPNLQQVPKNNRMLKSIVDESSYVNGIISGPFTLWADNDQIISLDYNGDGIKDILLFRPGLGRVCLNRSLKDGSFTNVFFLKDGLDGFSFANYYGNSTISDDQAITIDFDGDGKDDLMCYSPGSRKVVLERSNGDGTFTATYTSNNGMGGYDFTYRCDRAIALDFNGDKKMDLMFFRPGNKAVYLLQGNGDGTFEAILKSSNGLAGFNFDQVQDLAIALDYDGDGKDDVMCYRTGSKPTVYIQKSNGDGTFTNIYKNGNGIGGYNFDQIQDKAIALDYNGDGKDDIMCYRPRGSACYLLKSNGDGTFTTVYHNEGIAGFDLHDLRDRIISLDYNNDGYSDIIMYRSGMGYAFSAKSLGDGTYSLDCRQ
ncbi:MAG: VCBS repeat-containing protein [Bacteroidales bacterium]|nr:VCBS repeat-containing protein [Bacteroidales bacterium]